MLVSFWNGTAVRAGATTNAACISTYFSHLFKKRTVLFENHISKRNISHVLSGEFDYFNTHDIAAESQCTYGRYDTDYLYDCLEADLNVTRIPTTTREYMDGLLSYISQNERNYVINEKFDYRFRRVYDKFIDYLERKFDVVFADLRRSDTITTKHIIERSDLIFVNLPQDREMIGKFMINYPDEYRERSIYIISRYKEGQYGSEFFAMDHNVDYGRVISVPEFSSLYRLCSEGGLIDFLIEHKWDDSRSPFYGFIYSIKKLAREVDHKYRSSAADRADAELYMDALI